MTNSATVLLMLNLQAYGAAPEGRSTAIEVWVDPLQPAISVVDLLPADTQQALRRAPTTLVRCAVDGSDAPPVTLLVGGGSWGFGPLPQRVLRGGWPHGPAILAAPGARPGDVLTGTCESPSLPALEALSWTLHVATDPVNLSPPAGLPSLHDFVPDPLAREIVDKTVLARAEGRSREEAHGMELMAQLGRMRQDHIALLRRSAEPPPSAPGG